MVSTSGKGPRKCWQKQARGASYPISSARAVLPVPWSKSWTPPKTEIPHFSVFPLSELYSELFSECFFPVLHHNGSDTLHFYCSMPETPGHTPCLNPSSSRLQTFACSHK